MISHESSLFHYNKGRSKGNIKKDPPWAMMFAVDLVLCAMTRDEVEVDLEIWTVAFERHGLKISRTKTEYLPTPQVIQTTQ